MGKFEMYFHDTKTVLKTELANGKKIMSIAAAMDLVEVLELLCKELEK